MSVLSAGGRVRPWEDPVGQLRLPTGFDLGLGRLVGDEAARQGRFRRTKNAPPLVAQVGGPAHSDSPDQDMPGGGKDCTPCPYLAQLITIHLQKHAINSSLFEEKFI